jgi:hypothetical protein
VTRAGVLVLVLLGCGGARDAAVPADTATTSSAGATVASAAGSAAVPGKPACPMTGLWSTCAVTERLERAGLVPRTDSTAVSEAPLAATGTLLQVGNAELELYVYPDVRSRERAAAALEPSRYLEYSAPLSMQQLPTLIQSANLIAILHSRNDHQRERVGDALTAGPPQPPPSRP